MRLLHVTSGNLYGGVESVLRVFAQHRNSVPELSQEFAVCFRGRFSEELCAQGADPHFLGEVRWRYPWTVLRARRELSALLDREKFDVVACHSPWALGIFGPVVRRKGLRLAFWAHSPMEGKHWLERLALRVRPDFVVCNSDYTRSNMAGNFPDSKLSVILYPVSPPERSMSESRDEVRRELGIESSDVVLVQVGRLEEWKGQGFLIEALSKIRDIPGWKCLIVGGPQKAGEQEYFESLKRAAERFGIGERVLFLGQRKDVFRLLSASDIFVHPNLSPEPFGVVLIEALYSGLPVVTVSGGGAKEIVTPEVGIFIERPDIDRLVSALRELIGSKERREALSKGGPQRATELTDPQRQIYKLWDQLKDS